MPSSLIIQTQINSTIEATEVFRLMMENMLELNVQKIVSSAINNDSRLLSETSKWLLTKRGYKTQDIPKLGIV